MKVKIKRKADEGLDEMYSTAGSFGHSHANISPEDEHCGHVERSKHQGLQNVTEQQGILGKRVWPSANPLYQKDLDIWGEPDTEIERKLYLQLHKHFNTTSYWVKQNEPPLDAESIKALKSILASGTYAEDFDRCKNPQATMMRGMHVPLSWVKQNAPGALEAMSSDTEVLDYNKPFPVNFIYKSQGKYGGVSSWTSSDRVAKSFASTESPGGEISCIIYAKCDSGLFMNTQPFAKYKGGEYKKDNGIKKLNPARGEMEFLLFGESQVVGIQLRGPRMSQDTEITTEDIDRIIGEEIQQALSEKCWPGYERNPNVAKGERGSCRKQTNEQESEAPLEEKTDYSKEKDSGLHGWFSRQGGKGKSQGWVDCNTCRKDKKTGKKTCKSCGREDGEKRSKYPSCRPTPSACGTKGKGKKWGKKK